MTPEEALHDIISSGINLGAGDFVDVEALKVACIALEKQIPEKIHYSNGRAYCKCGAIAKLNSSWKSNYCNKCGQALDWSNEK